MHRRPLIALIAWLALPSASAMAKPPSWVLTDDEPISKAPDGATGAHWHFSDRQIRHTRKSIETYQRRVLSVHDETSLEMFADLAFYGPVTSVVHVRVIRNGKTIEVPIRLEKGTDDEGLEYRSVDLPALTIGDVIDYAWLEREPGDREMITGALVPSLGIPADRNRVRLLVPSSAGVKVALRGGAEAPQPTPAGAFTDYTWETPRTAETPYATDAPGWYAQSPVLYYSDVESWQRLAAILAERYDVSATPAEPVVRLAQTLASTDDSESDRAIALTLYVQQKIDYGWTAPGATLRSPAQVIADGEGSPLERARLLAALARALELDASVGMAHYGYRGHLREMLPSPDLPTTALTGIRIDGHAVWVDPVGVDVASQGLVTPPVETVLLIDRLSTGLIDVPVQFPFEPTVDVLEVYQLDSAGAATITITTTLRRSDARQLRWRLEHSDDRSELVDNARRYDRAFEQTAPPEFHDDPDANVLRVVQHYRIADFWADGIRTLAPYELVGQFTIPEIDRVPAPLAIPHPRFVRHRIRVDNLPEAFRIDGARQSAEHDAFAVSFSQAMHGRTLTLTWEYRSRADHVAADRVAAYERELDDLPMMYYLKWAAHTPGDSYWPRFLMVLAGFVVVGGGLQVLERNRVRRRATARVMTSEDRK